MAWSAVVESVTRSGGMVFPVVRFTDDQTSETFTQTFQADDIDSTRLLAIVKRRIASLLARDLAFATIVTGPLLTLVQYYAAFVAAWNAGGVPATYTGTALNGGMTTQQKLDAVNSWIGAANLTLVPTYKIYNAIVPADFVSLTAADQQRVRDIISMGSVDASSGTNVNAALQSIFAGKATTLANFVAIIDSFKTPWWRTNGYSGPLTTNDATKAGVS